MVWDKRMEERRVPDGWCFNMELEGRSVVRIPTPPTLTFDLDFPEFNHLIPCGQGYDRRSLITVGLELARTSTSY